MDSLALVRKVLTWRTFRRRDDVTRPLAIIAWWELRRIPYNVAVGLTGMLTITAVEWLVESEAAWRHQPVDPDWPPTAAMVGVILYGLMANVCFTGGWITELFVRKVWQDRAGSFAQIAFFFGFVASILLTLLPIAVCAASVAVRLMADR